MRRNRPHKRLSGALASIVFALACAHPQPIPSTANQPIAPQTDASPALPPHTFHCTLLGDTAPGQEQQWATRSAEAPVVFVGNSVWECPCEFRHLGGNREDRSLAGASEDRTLGGGSEDRSLGGASEDRTLGGTSEDRTLGGASEDRTLGGASEDRTLGGASEDRTLGGASEDRTLGGASEDRALGGDSESRTLAGASERITCTITPDECPRFTVSGSLPLRWIDGGSLQVATDRCVR